MKIIKIWGGVGNQLFQYALYKEIKSQDIDTYIDLSWFEKTNDKFYYPYQLEKLGLEATQVPSTNKFVHSPFEFDILRHTKSNSYFSRVLQIVYYILRINKQKLICISEDELYKYNKIVFSQNNSYLPGFWQNLQYFNNSLIEMRKNIIFEDSSEEIKQIEDLMESTQSVSIHIRRSDYTFEDFDEICTAEYYKQAVKYMCEHIVNPMFFVFSNKIEKAKQILGNGENYIYVQFNDRVNGLGDLKLMTLCKYNIISNSTFSWWGAVLNKKEDSLVIMPKKWKEKYNNLNLCLEGWLEI